MMALKTKSPWVIAPVIAVLISGLFMGVTLLLQYLWNTTLPDLFGVKPIAFWQTFRLFLLTSILVGGSHAVTVGGDKGGHKLTSQYIFNVKNEAQ